MPNEETRQLQNLSVERLRILFSDRINDTIVDIVKEWLPFSGQNGISSPIIDVAVGPFAIEERMVTEYNLLLERARISSFIRHIVNAHIQNLERYNIPRNVQLLDNFTERQFTNENSRCFMAIEIEGREDRKVVLADIVNVAAMGRVGVIVAKTEKVLRIFVRLLYYLWFLQRAGKPTFNTGNVLIITQRQFRDILR